MSHFPEDLHHRTSTRLGQIVPNYIEDQYPVFFEFLRLYYQFLEQYDEQPTVAAFIPQTGVVSIFANSSEVIGNGTDFTSVSPDNSSLLPYQNIRIGAESFSVRSVTNATSLIVYEVSSQTQYGVSYTVEVNRSSRQASGALRQLLQLHNVDDTLPDLIPYFRDQFLRDLPAGVMDTATLIPRILDFYRARGSEESYRFLFRVLYDTDVRVSYPRDYTFKASDGIYETPRILTLDKSTFIYGTERQFLVQDIYALAGREIVGLKSAARARVVDVREEQLGPITAVSLLLEDVTVSTETSRLLIQEPNGSDISPGLLFTDFGTPPTQQYNQVYSFSAVTEESRLRDFLPDEYISTLPLSDPYKIQAAVTGTVVGFIVRDGGQGYVAGDIISVPPGYNGGYGAIGKVTGFANTQIESIAIINGGEGYYQGLPLIVDNDGTGGSGLSGVVGAVSAGNILLETDEIDTPNDLPDKLLFEFASVTSDATREDITYYETSESLQSVLSWNLLQDSNVFGVDGSRILLNGSEGAVTLEPPKIGDPDWSMSQPTSVLYNASLSSIIANVLNNKSVFPIYINGVRRSIGSIRRIDVTSTGRGYILKVPVVSVTVPVRPLTGTGDTVPLTEFPFIPAQIVATTAPGRIASIEVISGGVGYNTQTFGLLWPESSTQYITLFAENALEGIIEPLIQEPPTITDSFVITPEETSSQTGVGGEVSIVVGGVFNAPGRPRGTAGQASGEYKLQEITYYQPFSYVLESEISFSVYEPTVKRFVHPAGGLLLPVQIVSSEASFVATIDSADITVTGL